MKRLILIDSHAIIHRAYHALPPLTTPKGEPVNAVYGFTSILLKIIKELKPDYIAAAFDMQGPTFRHAAYERYKAQRPEAPSDLKSQFAKVREMIDAFGISHFEKTGFEADDIIGTIAEKLKKEKDVELIIVTGDMDTLQLIRPRVFVYAMKKGISDIVMYDENAVKERYGLDPPQLVDFKGLKGDPSDNIAGVKGIGEKTATELIQTFGSIDALYKSLKGGSKKISASVAAKLREGEEDAKLSRELARIKTDMDIPFRLEDARWNGIGSETRLLLQHFGFFSLLKRAQNGAQDVAGSKMQKKENQPGLFAEQNGKEKMIGAIQETNDWKNFVRGKKDSFGLILLENALYAVRASDKKSVRLEERFLKSKELSSFFETHDDLLVYDAKFFFHFLQPFGIHVEKAGFDMLLAAYVVNSTARDFSYAGITGRELGRLVSSRVENELPYFFDIVASLQKKLKEGKLKHVFEKIELPLSSILASMEERGIAIDKAYLETLSGDLEKERNSLTKKIYSLAGEEFNVNSTQQLSKILFEKLNIKAYGLRKTEKGGVVSTSASELEKLRALHPVVEKILEYRELTKLQNTYVDVLPQLVNPKTGRIHTTFNQTGTATGRLSSANPNLQNIPTLSDYGKKIRNAFVAERGFLLVSFDYSQIELRVAAHLAGDKKMIEAFKKGSDIHAITASEIYNVPLEKVTSELRRNAKTLNFGILYGMGPNALSESTGMPREEAKKFIDEYFRDFAGVREWIQKTKTFAEENGYVETLFGRRRPIPEILSPNWQMKREAERMAVNMPVQGTAADLVKIAMIRVDGFLKKEGHSDAARMLLQVHDELLFEVKEDGVSHIAQRIKEIMEQTAKLRVPLVVDVKFGKNWGNMQRLYL